MTVVQMGQAGPMAAAAATSGSDRVPGEIALVGICAAALIAVTAVMFRRGRLARQHRDRTAHYRVPERVSAVAEPDAAMSANADSVGPEQHRVGAEYEPVTEAAVVADSLVADAHGPDWNGNPRRASVLVAAVATVLLVGGVGSAVFFIGSSHDTANHGAVAVNPTPAHDPAILGAAAGKAAPGTRRSAGPANSHPATSSPSASSVGAAAPSSGARSSAGATVQTSPGTLGDFPAQPVQLDQPGAAATVFTASISFTADGGPVSYTVSELPADDSFYTITADPPSGNLSAGRQATIMVTVILVGNGTDPGPASVTVDPGGTVIQFKLPIIRRQQ